ncbi:MAG TPA: GNAT family N-acetyltransferase [Acetobacteraceae bacterium]
MGVTVQNRVDGAWHPARLPDASLALDVLSTLPALERLVPEWVALWSRAEAPLPFTHPGWMLAWWRTLGGGALRVFTVRADGRLVAVLSMFIYPDSGVSRLLPLGISVSDAFDLVAEPGWSRQAAAALVRAIRTDEDGWDRCELHEVPCSSALHGPAAKAVLQSVSPALDLERFAALPSRSGPRRRLARAQRMTAEAGLLLDQPGLDAMDDLFTLHAAQWQARGEAGVLASAPVQAFHRQAARALARTDTLRLHRLRDGARTVAVLYGFQLRDRAYAYLSGIHPAYARLGLGTVLIGAAISTARADGARELDFLRGAERYKHAWGATDRVLLRLDLPAGAQPRSSLRLLPCGLDSIVSTPDSMRPA